MARLLNNPCNFLCDSKKGFVAANNRGYRIRNLNYVMQDPLTFQLHNLQVRFEHDHWSLLLGTIAFVLV